MILDSTYYTPPNPKLWHGRLDSLPKERFFQHVSCLDITKAPQIPNQSPVILGFCSDEGVRRNLGQVGAQTGPDALREQFGKLASHTSQDFIDIGNVCCKETNLEAAQDALANLVAYIHQDKHQSILFGGGHEIAWPHFKGLSNQYSKLGIINFDAHFDIRPISGSQGTSGTPFTQIKTYCDQNNSDFEYCCLGIQPFANTQSLVDKAREWGISFLTAAQIQQDSLETQIEFLQTFIQRIDHIYLTICLDVFSEQYAPGVSAPQAMGIDPWRALPLLKIIQQSGKVVSLDIAELSPPLDVRDKTARLGATLLAELF